jgi:hypothetical protein
VGGAQRVDRSRPESHRAATAASAGSYSWSR